MLTSQGLDFGIATSHDVAIAFTFCTYVCQMQVPPLSSPQIMKQKVSIMATLSGDVHLSFRELSFAR